MKENDWTRYICSRLKKVLKASSLDADTLHKLPYSQEVEWYSEDWVPKRMDPTEFETDLIIFEKDDQKIKPRVIIEAKLGNITTHDAITYSYKADKHKNVIPYLRYGIMIGDRKHYPLPGRLYRHGTNFDFMFSFVGTKPTKDEWESFTEMVLKEVDYSKQIEEMLRESRHKDRKRYYMLQKQLVLKEMND